MSAEVLPLPSQPDGKHFYQDAGLPSTPPRGPSPTSSPFLDTTPRPSRRSRPPTPHAEHKEWLPAAPPPPSTSQSTFSSEVATAAYNGRQTAAVGTRPLDSHLTLDTDIALPQYDARFGNQHDEQATPPSSPNSGEELSDELNEISASDTTRSDSPLPTPTVADDFAIKEAPSRQVDFLSHDWREEDIWSSWRHIVSQRKAVYGEMSRLENASWRTWAKSKYRLPTVSPARLNWLKESDVTWLYGPLKSASTYPITSGISEPSSQISRSNSFAAKKPILKKRSMSEIMLQKSISTSSLVRQAAASVQAQGRSSRKLEQGADIVDSKMQSDTPSRDQMDYFASRSTSSTGTPCEYSERRHIRFDDRVEQCIAVEAKDNGNDYGDDSDGETSHPARRGSDSGSDDGLLIRTSIRHDIQTQRSSSKGSTNNSQNGRKTIETLPSTTLKFGADTPDTVAEAQHHTFGRSWGSGKLSPSPSQETLRPSNPSNNYLLPDEDEEEEEEEIDSDSSWSFGASNPKSSLGASAGGSSRRTRSSGSKNRSSTPAPHETDYEIAGMRRTGSGMFMPYDEDEDDATAQGLFGRVSETFNTARDIAHVIWNVGWRK